MSTLKTTIKFDTKNNTFRHLTEATEAGMKGIVENVIQAHIGAGRDDSKRNDRDIYSITITWDFSDDSFVINSDTGNKGLTDGILMHFLKGLK